MSKESIRLDSRYEQVFRFSLPRMIAAEVNPFHNIIPADDHVVFDVGANVGIWTKAWLDCFGQRLRRLHMFEPLPGNIKKIKSSIRDGFFAELSDEYTEKMILNEFAVGDENKKIQINYEAEVSGLASVVQKLSQFPGKTVSLNKNLMVQQKTLDSYCSENDIEKIDVLKIDTEGNELNVLRGAQRMFSEKRVGAVSFEFGLHQLSPRHNFKDFWDFFSDNGYNMCQFGLGQRGWEKIRIERYQGRFEDMSAIFVYCGYHPKYWEKQ